MPYITHIERSGFEKGRLEGVRQGVQQGVRQGVHQGVRQGVRQGVQQGKAELLRKLLQRRFGTLPVSIVDRLVHAAPSDLDAWSERILDAESLDDVFVDG